VEIIILLVILCTSIWVLVDAKTIAVKKGQMKGMADMGPWGWFFACLLIWIIGFPFYLAKRGELKKVNSAQSSKMNGDSIKQLEKLGELKEKGILTEEEFNEKKKELLS